jgi:starvation-inducible outer membrane lipoprotein
MTQTRALFGAAALLSACASSPMMMKVDNTALPEAVVCRPARSS